MATSYQKRTAERNINSWKNSRYTDLYSAYDKPSSKKIDAWNYCIRKKSEYNGSNLKVISRNTYMFTAGFEYKDKETGEFMFMLITPSYDVSVPLTI